MGGKSRFMVRLPNPMTCESRLSQGSLSAVKMPVLGDNVRRILEGFMKGAKLSGRCFCGAVQYRVIGQPDDAFFCHCESCRRSSGAPVVAWGRVHQNRFEVTQGELSKFASSPEVTRSRCARCGTEVLYQHEDCSPDLDFPLATLRTPGDVAPRYHVRAAEKLPWIEINDALPQHAGWRPKKAG